MKLFKSYLLLLVLALPAWAQTIIFPGLSGQALLDNLVIAYKPATVLSYNDARDLMFGTLNNVNDSVACFYTDYKVYIDPNSALAPRTQAYNAGLDTEHSWPQSLGASGNARSDIHHLFPTRTNVNSDRGNLPYGEINDNLTDRWYYLNQVITTIPGANIDEYSELDLNVRFEVRENHKGDIARALFYFYTMYADQADPNFFAVQKEVLRQWSFLDPVDGVELTRTDQIAAVQEDKPNPFVLDTTLIGRAYFGISTALSGQTGEQPATSFTLHPNYPNPFNPQTVITFELAKAGIIELSIFDAAGKKVRTFTAGVMLPGRHRVVWDGKDGQGRAAASGIYVYRLQGAGSAPAARKMLLIR